MPGIMKLERIERKQPRNRRKKTLILFVQMGLRKLILLVIITVCYRQSYSQAAWDINYVAEDAIDDNYIGKTVKIDFKKKQGVKDNSPHRFFLSREDTAGLRIDNKFVRFKEEREIYDDWGLYKEQYLESLNAIGDKTKLRISDCIVKKINPDSVLFTANIETYIVKRKKKEITGSWVEDIWVERNKLEGVIFKRE